MICHSCQLFLLWIFSSVTPRFQLHFFYQKGFFSFLNDWNLGETPDKISFSLWRKQPGTRETWRRMWYIHQKHRVLFWRAYRALMLLEGVWSSPHSAWIITIPYIGSSSWTRSFWLPVPDAEGQYITPSILWGDCSEWRGALRKCRSGSWQISASCYWGYLILTFPPPIHILTQGGHI